LDTFAFFTYFEEEDGVDTVESLFEMSKNGEIEIFASFISYSEVFYITCQNEGEESAKCRIDLMNKLPIDPKYNIAYIRFREKQTDGKRIDRNTS